MKKRLLSLFTALALCLSIVTVPGLAYETKPQRSPKSQSASGTVHTLEDGGDLRALMTTVKDGDTIVLKGTGNINDNASTADPWVIDKAVTIQGGDIYLRSGGILLGKDVTFKDTKLLFANAVRNAIIVNGHTLTLENVILDRGQGNVSGRNVHLVAGSLTHHTVTAPAGSHSRIQISGNTDLGETCSIYAGSIAHDQDPNRDPSGNTSSLPVTITIDQSCKRTAGKGYKVYACGAKETYVDPNDLFGMKEPAPPAADPAKFTVTGSVDIQLYGSVVQSVDGRTGGDTNASVIYDNDGNKNDNLSLSNIASLTVRSGDLQPAGISSTAPIALSVASGAILGLQNIGSAAVSDFTGGGTLVLGVDQTLDIQGKVTGKTKVALGEARGENSKDIPKKDHAYISAPNSGADAFTLLPPVAQPSLSFTRNDQGQWLVPSGAAPVIKISTISVVSETTVSAKDTPVDIPVEVTYADGALGYLSDISMASVSYEVDGSRVDNTSSKPGSYTFSSTSKIQEIGFGTVAYDDGDKEVISVTGRGTDGSIEPGTYAIRFSIAPKDMADGNMKSVETRLIVTRDVTPGPDPVPGDLGKAEVTVAGGSVYTGNVVEPQVTVTLGGTTLAQGTDYTVQYADNINAGTAKVTVTAVDGGKYTGSAEKTFTIEKAKLTCQDPVLAPKTYDGTADASVDSASFYQGADKKDLAKGRDYTAQGAYNSANVKDADTVTVNVALMGDTAANYTLENGSLSVGGSIAKAQTQSVPGSLTVTTHQAMDYSYDLSKLLPAPDAGKSYGTVTYALGDIQLGQYYTPGTASIKDGTLILPIPEVTKAQEGPIGTVKIQITADNYTVGDAVISVDAVSKQTPQGQPQLSTHTLIYGQPLSTIKLSGAMADASGKPVPGSFTWNDPGKLYTVGTHLAPWTFVPQDTGTYLTVSGDSSIQVDKAAPSGAPQYTPITTSGKTLADAGLTAPQGSFNVPGKVKWALPASTPVQANTAYEWIFTPDDTANYTELTGQITLYTSSGGGEIPTPPVPPTPPTPPTPPMPPMPPMPPAPPKPNPDGSTTETVTKPDGSSVSTTKYPDGSSVSTEIKRDGTITTVKRDSKGSTIEAVAKPDGSVHTIERRTDGTKVETTSDRYGETYAKVEIPRAGVKTKVTIPTPFKPVPGEVLVIVSPDGTEKVVRKTSSSAEGLTFTADKNVTVKVQSRGKTFSDVPANHWARDCVAFATARELFNGVSETSFAPNAHMTRGMLAVVLHNLEDAPHSQGEHTFRDVSNGHWSSEAIQWAADKGIVSGYEDGRFGPDDAITREQLAVMLYRYAGSPAVSNRYLGFTDAHKVGGFAQEAVCWAVENGILSGIGNGVLDPTGTATRGQVSMMLMRYIENVQ